VALLRLMLSVIRYYLCDEMAFAENPANS